MARKGKSEEQVIAILREVESGKAVVEVCRKAGISVASYYRWKKQFSGMGIAELRELQQLREENGELNRGLEPRTSCV
jgi:putative transposase